MLLGALVGAGVPARRAAGARSTRSRPSRSRSRVEHGHPQRLRGDPVPRRGRRLGHAPAPGATSAPCSSGPTLADGGARPGAGRVFERLAVAEARRARRRPADDVHFHEVGALDAIADVVGVCAGFVAPRPRRGRGLARSRSAPGRSAARTARCRSRRRRSPSCCAASRRTPARRRAGELCTPTGAALLTTLADAWGPQPAMTVDRDRRRRGRPRPGGARQRAAAAGRATLDRRAPAPTRPAGARDQRRRPRPAALARRDRRAARGRRLRRLADADPDEEGPPGPHPVRAGRRRPGGGGPARRSTGRPRRSACASSRSASAPSTARWATVEVDGPAGRGQAGAARRRGGQRAAGVRRRGGRRRRARATGQRRARQAAAAAAGPSRRPDRTARWTCRSSPLAFGAIFLVELPDKTFIATLVLATRFRPLAGLDRCRPGVRGADPGRGRGSARPATLLPERAGPARSRSRSSCRRGRAVPRGPGADADREGAGGGVRRQGHGDPSRLQGRRSRASWSCSPPSGATCPSC